MKLSELIEKAKITLELFGDGEVYQVGDCGEFHLLTRDFVDMTKMGNEKNHIEWMQIFLIKNNN